MNPTEKPTLSQLWLLLTILCGFGGFFVAVVLSATNPAWCSRPYIGCMGGIILFAAGGWLFGFGASVLSLKNAGDGRGASSIVLTWNALGLLACIAFVLMITFRR